MIDNRQKVLNLLGLAQKSQNLISGAPQVIEGIRNSSVQLVFLATDTAKNNQKDITNKASYYKVPIITDFTSHDFEQAIGKNRKILAICDKGFSQAIKKYYSEEV